MEEPTRLIKWLELWLDAGAPTEAIARFLLGEGGEIPFEILETVWALEHVIIDHDPQFLRAAIRDGFKRWFWNCAQPLDFAEILKYRHDLSRLIFADGNESYFQVPGGEFQIVCVDYDFEEVWALTLEQPISEQILNRSFVITTAPVPNTGAFSISKSLNPKGLKVMGY